MLIQFNSCVRETSQSPQSSVPTITRSQSPDYWFPPPATAHQAPLYQGSLHTCSSSGLPFTTLNGTRLSDVTYMRVLTIQSTLLQRCSRSSSDTLLWLTYKERDSDSNKTYQILSSSFQLACHCSLRPPYPQLFNKPACYSLTCLCLTHCVTSGVKFITYKIISIQLYSSVLIHFNNSIVASKSFLVFLRSANHSFQGVAFLQLSINSSRDMYGKD